MLYILEKERFLPETNSSSVHSFSISYQKPEGLKEKVNQFLEENDWKLVVNKLGECGFGWEFESYTTWESIWNWLLISAYNSVYSELYWREGEPDKIQEDSLLMKLKKKVENFVEHEVTFYTAEEWREEMISKRWCYIDHESSDIPEKYISDSTLLLEEILSGILRTGNDNV